MHNETLQGKDGQEMKIERASLHDRSCHEEGIEEPSQCGLTVPQERIKHIRPCDAMQEQSKLSPFPCTYVSLCCPCVGQASMVSVHQDILDIYIQPYVSGYFWSKLWWEYVHWVYMSVCLPPCVLVHIIYSSYLFD